MSKHTQGKWSITKFGYDDNLIFKFQIGTPEKTVAYAYSNTGDRTEEQEANANFIALAPELLEALKDAYPLVADDAKRRKIGELIAKAEGK